MSMRESVQPQAVLWGQAYELLVKRGVLTRLVDEGLLSVDDPRVAEWRQVRLAQVTGALKRELDLLDVAMSDVVEAGVEHFALSAFGTGYTATREYLKPLRAKLSNGKLKLRGLYCPLSLPGSPVNDEGARERARSAFAGAFGMAGTMDPAWTDKGMPARADFLLWLSGDAAEDHLLVQEYSFDMAGDLPDFRTEDAHLQELLNHRRLIETRGVFARVAAEVDGEAFDLSSDIKNHLLAFTSENKPLYKLCQACGYGEATERVLRAGRLLTKPCVVRALAITPNGLESLSAVFGEHGAPMEPRRHLMAQMGTAYRQATKLPDGADEALTAKVMTAFNAVFRRLPRNLRQGLKPLTAVPEPGQDYEFVFKEQVSGFVSPARRYSVTEALAYVDDTTEAAEYFAAPAPAAVGTVLCQFERDGEVTLRDLHAAAIVAGLRSASPGQVNVIALEGNPGIGKTTAVIRDLARRTGGYLFVYLSPRVVINRDVTDKMARSNGAPTGTLTLTTNAELIAGAERWYRAQVKAGQATKRRVEAAVVVDGVEGLIKPEGSTLVLSPEQEAEIESTHAGSRISKTTLSEHEDLVQERSLPGVLSTMAEVTRDLLELNPELNRVVLTAALQGFRDKGGGKTTLQSLSKLFKNANASSKAGLEERRRFARRHPTVFVMVDELAGDGAGAPFVNEVARWLQAEFIDCFADHGEPSPFTVALIVSDASLANDVVLDRYLNAGTRTPDKVLVSQSVGSRPFRLAVGRMKVGGGKKTVLHVMANSFPASALDIRYRVRLHHVPLLPKDGVLPSPRRAIRDACGDKLLASAMTEILAALDHGARQVIYFAQDKQFLGDLRTALVRDEEHDLTYATVAILDSSVPGAQRKRLVDPVNRDQILVFLMTSSGARGISFPKTDWIIAHVPRFSVECALMEISQLVYRGRGQYHNAQGEVVSGDDVPRHLVMLVDDFLVSDAAPNPRQWLRQSMDLMTLLVMLRSTLLTRMTGDSGLRQPIAFVPVGGTGLSELVVAMAQFVRDFLRECDVYLTRHTDEERIRLVKSAQGNVKELFGNAHLRGEAIKGGDGRSFARSDEVTRLMTVATTAIAPLLAPSGGSVIPDHMYFAGPLVYENWADFDKKEIFSFEGHATQTQTQSRHLYAQLAKIDEDAHFPAALRRPAANLRRLLSREKPEAANEFNTTKLMRSPNTWLAVPAGYPQFVRADGTEGVLYRCKEPEEWHGALCSALLGGAAVAPAIATYESFPWAASVGMTDPLGLQQMFDDRYFMASSELNLLNTLLLCERDRPEGD